jgi:hypothetical protein
MACLAGGLQSAGEVVNAALAADGDRALARDNFRLVALDLGD